MYGDPSHLFRVSLPLSSPSGALRTTPEQPHPSPLCPYLSQAVATFLAKEDGIIAGLGVAEMVFKMQDESCTVEWSVKEGDRVKNGECKGTKFLACSLPLGTYLCMDPGSHRQTDLRGMSADTPFRALCHFVRPGHKFGVVRGPARAVLVGERVALNLMQRMSGVATATRRMVDQVEGTRAKVRDGWDCFSLL